MELLGFAMAAQFASDGKGGWLYRKDQTGPAIPATQAERDRYVRRYGWIVAGSLPVLFVLVISGAIVMNALIPNPTNLQGALGAIPIAVIGMGGTYLYLKWFSHAPARDLADRAPVAPARPLAAVFGGRVAKTSYRKIALGTAGMMLFAALAAFDQKVPDADRRWAILYFMAVPLIIGLGGAWWKWQIERSAK